MKYFLGLIACIGLIVLVFVLVLRGFSGKGEPKDQVKLADYANTASSMEMTIDGPIVAEQDHIAYRIAVNRDETRIDTLKGYEYVTVESKTFTNNQESYQNFLRALDIAGFTVGNKDSANKDERGQCAQGNRFIFEIKNGSSDVQRLWSATCKGMGTFKGNTAEVKRLFDSQIPRADFSKLIGKINL